MPSCRPRREGVFNLAGYLAVIALTVLVLIWALRLWEVDLRVPFGYGGDALFTAAQVQSVLESGSHLIHPRLGAPFQGELYDLPLAESLHFGIVKLIAAGVGDLFLAINLYYLLTFPLCALTAYVVLRHFRCGRVAALVASVLFAFLPCHYSRGTYHLFLAAYYLIPLLVMVLIWLCQGTGGLFTPREGSPNSRLVLSYPKAFLSVLICLLTACAGAYYAFFGCFFLGVAGLIGWARGRFRAFVAAALFVAVLVGGGLVNVLPNLMYGWKHGANPLTQRHFSGDAERYGLKVTSLVLPVPHHRLHLLARLRRAYDAQQEWNESSLAPLGMLASAGFVLLLARLFARRSLGVFPAGGGPSSAPAELEEGLSFLNGAGVLLAITGGLGCLVALLMTASIRAYVRINVYLAFLSLFALVLFLESWLRRYRGSRLGRWLCHAGLLLLIPLGVLDQTPEGVAVNGHNRKQFQAEAAFVRQIEATVSKGAMIFQMPYIPYPEAPPPLPGTIKGYDHLRGCLLSRSLRWSFGTMKGRSGDEWQARVAALPVPEMVQELVEAGFEGIYIDRQGYADKAAEIERVLSQIVKESPRTTRDGNLLFFDLNGWKASRTGSLATAKPPAPSTAARNGD
jgi:phosphoglycerol transferase